MIKVAAFDFDGTIADSFDLFIETFRKIAPVGVDTTLPIDDLRGLSVPEILKKLKIKRVSVPRLIIRGRKEMAKGVPTLAPFNGLASQLQELQNRGIKVCILSSNRKASIQSFLAANILNAVVDEVSGDISLFGKAKAIKKLAKSKDCSMGELVYIGDEVRDIVAAKKAGVASIAVSWGFNTKNALEQNKPDYIVDAPSELIKVITKL